MMDKEISMNIHDREEDLFSKWETNRGDFVRDGVVCEAAYRNTAPKIAVVLKEPHGDNGGDIRNWLRDVKSKDRTWDTVARWVYGIKNRKSLPAWKDFPETTPERKTEMFQGVCAINLKKAAGGSAANYSEIERIAREDAEYIRKQYAFYKPDLTICCGVGSLFKEVIGHCDKKSKPTTRGVQYWTWENGKHVLDFFHPARPIESTLKLYPLIDAINEIYSA
ncbi:MAG: hypothetical protein OXU96_09545 [Gammaproteobacteria bacterium]|nr:hypothetical protein [Gammaproteobacteria bacterium]